MKTSVQSNVLSYGAYNISGTGVLNFILFCLVFCLICVYIFEEDGYLKKWFSINEFLIGVSNNSPSLLGDTAQNQTGK